MLFWAGSSCSTAAGFSLLISAALSMSVDVTAGVVVPFQSKPLLRQNSCECGEVLEACPKVENGNCGSAYDCTACACDPYSDYTCTN